MGKFVSFIVVLLLLINTALLYMLVFPSSKKKMVDVKDTEMVETTKIKNFLYQGNAIKIAPVPNSAVIDWNKFRSDYPKLVDSIYMVEGSISAIKDSISRANIATLPETQQVEAGKLYNVLGGINDKLDQLVDVGNLALLKHDAGSIKGILDTIDKNVASLKKVSDMTDKVTGYLTVILHSFDVLMGIGIVKPATVASIPVAV